MNRLDDDLVVVELNNKDDQVRKTFALKCVQAMSQTRVRKLLDKYVNQDGERFYNSVHWLDLGASLPEARSKNAVKSGLEKLN